MIYNWPVNKKKGETWVINNPIFYIGNVDCQIQFKSNNEIFSRLIIDNTVYGKINYGGTKEVYTTQNGWINDAYKTLTFLEEITNDTLLKWLGYCAIKQ